MQEYIMKSVAQTEGCVTYIFMNFSNYVYMYMNIHKQKNWENTRTISSSENTGRVDRVALPPTAPEYWAHHYLPLNIYIFKLGTILELITYPNIYFLTKYLIHILLIFFICRLGISCIQTKAALHFLLTVHTYMVCKIVM